MWAGGLKQQPGQNWVSCSASRHKIVTRTTFALLPQTTSKLGQMYKTRIDFKTPDKLQLRTQTAERRETKCALQPTPSYPKAVSRLLCEQVEPRGACGLTKLKKNRVQRVQAIKSLGQHARGEGVSQTQISGFT